LKSKRWDVRYASLVDIAEADCHFRLRSFESTMNAGWIAPSMTIIGPDWKANFASGRHIFRKFGAGSGRSQQGTRADLMRAVIYARYSSDLQREASIED
jgi:hypothetical protein